MDVGPLQLVYVAHKVLLERPVLADPMEQMVVMRNQLQPLLAHKAHKAQRALPELKVKRVLQEQVEVQVLQAQLVLLVRKE